MAEVDEVFPLAIEGTEGLVLQAILVLFPTAEILLKIELGDRADSEEPFKLIRGDEGLDVSLSNASRSVCVCCSTETETTLAVDVVGWDTEDKEAGSDGASGWDKVIPFKSKLPFVFDWDKGWDWDSEKILWV